MLQDQELEAYRRAGKLLAEVRERIRPMVKVGESLVRIAEEAERLIQEKGARPAFPCNVSLNEVAAHYSPPFDDPTVIKEGDLVKVDLGAHLDGYIADTAFTVATDEEGRALKEAAEKALEAAIAAVRAGVDAGEVGRAVEEAARGAGFKPVANLTGHALSRWTLHGGLTIPNTSVRTGQRLESGAVVALEPFVTGGAGYVEDTREVLIFRYLGERPVRLRMTRELLRDLKKTYNGLPFAERWLARRMSRLRLRLTLRELVDSGALWPYHVLVERAGKKVAQAEHTVLVTEGGCEVLTA